MSHFLYIEKSNITTTENKNKPYQNLLADQEFFLIKK